MTVLDVPIEKFILGDDLKDLEVVYLCFEVDSSPSLRDWKWVLNKVVVHDYCGDFQLGISQWIDEVPIGRHERLVVRWSVEWAFGVYDSSWNREVTRLDPDNISQIERFVPGGRDLRRQCERVVRLILGLSDPASVYLNT